AGENPAAANEPDACGQNESETKAPRAKGQRREPAPGAVRFVTEQDGWLPFAEPSGWTTGSALSSLPAMNAARKPKAGQTIKIPEKAIVSSSAPQMPVT